MIKFRVGDIVSVEFPFSDLHTHKRRPGLVLVSGDLDLLVARVTTHPPRDPSDVALNHWARDRFATGFDRSPNKTRHDRPAPRSPQHWASALRRQQGDGASLATIGGHRRDRTARVKTKNGFTTDDVIFLVSLEQDFQ